MLFDGISSLMDGTGQWAGYLRPSLHVSMLHSLKCSKTLHEKIRMSHRKIQIFINLAKEMKSSEAIRK